MLMFSIRENEAGFSLVEVVLALSIGALIMSSLVIGFTISLESGSKNYAASEAIQHGRVAMARILADLHHTAKVKEKPTEVFEIFTRQLVDDDWAPEVVRYEFSAANAIVLRSVDGGPADEIAGSPTENIRITEFNVALLKYNAGKTGYEDFIETDTLDKAVAAKVTIRLQDRYNRPFLFISTAHFENN